MHANVEPSCTCHKYQNTACQRHTYYATGNFSEIWRGKKFAQIYEGGALLERNCREPRKREGRRHRKAANSTADHKRHGGVCVGGRGVCVWGGGRRRMLSGRQYVRRARGVSEMLWEKSVEFFSLSPSDEKAISVRGNRFLSAREMFGYVLPSFWMCGSQWKDINGNVWMKLFEENTSILHECWCSLTQDI